MADGRPEREAGGEIRAAAKWLTARIVESLFIFWIDHRSFGRRSALNVKNDRIRITSTWNESRKGGEEEPLLNKLSNQTCPIAFRQEIGILFQEGTDEALNTLTCVNVAALLQQNRQSARRTSQPRPNSHLGFRQASNYYSLTGTISANVPVYDTDNDSLANHREWS